MSTKVNESREPKCVCQQDCDCEFPPPDDWDGKNGCFLVSLSCPKHNDFPIPDPDCRVHHTRKPVFLYW